MTALKRPAMLLSALSLASFAAIAGGGPLDLSSGSTSFGSTPPVGGFTEEYTFSLDVSSTVSGSITSVLNGLQDVDFSFIGIIGTAGVYSFTSRLSDPFETWGLSSVVIPAGNYTLTIIGTNSPAAGSYAGTLAATAIPEPQTYVLMLMGLLVVGRTLQRIRN